MMSRRGLWMCFTVFLGAVIFAGQAAAVVTPSPNDGLLQYIAGGHVLGFTSDRMYLVGKGYALIEEFVGSREGVQPVSGGTDGLSGQPASGAVAGKGTVPEATSGEGAAAGTGAERTAGRAFRGSVTYPGLWKGITLRYRSVSGGVAESEYIVGPGGSVSDIGLWYNWDVAIERDGSLRLVQPSSGGYLTQSAPIAWQEIGGDRRPVKASFRLAGDRTVGFEVESYDGRYPLIIDPAYRWHTFYGSASRDIGYSIALDGSGNVYVTGRSDAAWVGPSLQLPKHAYSGGSDIFVLKLSQDGAYQWHTFYGSSGSYDWGQGIAFRHGYVYVTGGSPGTWNGPGGELPKHGFNGTGDDFFVLKLSQDGVYQWHTFYGSTGTSDDWGNGIVLAGPEGNVVVFVMGFSYGNWVGPALQPPKHAYSGDGSTSDIFVLKLDQDGAYQWHTFYGSSSRDFGWGIALGSGSVYISGYSDASWQGPTGQAPLNPHAGGFDIFILKLATADGTYQGHTFYGSSQDDIPLGIAFSNDNIYVTGYSNASWNAGSTQPLHAFTSGGAIFILKLGSDWTYKWHTFYGSSSTDSGQGIAVDGAENVFITGQSGSFTGPNNEPPLNPGGYGSGGDIFILKLGSNGTYKWHTFYGSSGIDYGWGIAVFNGHIYVTGDSQQTWSAGSTLPLHAFAGGGDLVVLRMSDDVVGFPWLMLLLGD